MNDLLLKLRKFEHLHIVFWLLKDSCWMMEFKTFGVMMVVPTVLLAVYLVLRTLNDRDVYINAAILCWISANSYWMVVEFFFNNSHKEISAIPFALGLVFVSLYYLLPKRNSLAEKQI